jgi:hypothetical protein
MPIFRFIFSPADAHRHGKDIDIDMDALMETDKELLSNLVIIFSIMPIAKIIYLQALACCWSINLANWHAR